MSRLGVLIALASSVVLAGVQTAQAKPPPAVDTVLREQAKLPACSSQPLVVASEPQKLEDMRKAGQAVPADLCHPSYSKTFVNAMRSHKLSVACGTLYDVNREGVGTRVETRCDFAGDDLDADWRRFFETVLVSAIGRAASARLKFEPAPASDQPATREGFVGFSLNAGGTELPPMSRFQRARPQ